VGPTYQCLSEVAAYRFGARELAWLGHFLAWAAWSPRGLSSLFYFFPFLFFSDFFFCLIDLKQIL
jgi:hypothetical protein